MKKYVSQSGFGYELSFEYNNGSKYVMNARNNCGSYEVAEYSAKSMLKNELLNQKELKSVTYKVVEFN